MSKAKIVLRHSLTTKWGSHRLENIHEVWMMMMMMAVGLIWAQAAKKCEKLKVFF